MIWTEENIKEQTYKLMKKLNVEYMPTHTDMKNNQLSGLSIAINKQGGTQYWMEELGLEKKPKVPKWTDGKIERGIKECMKVLAVDRMPSSTEFTSIGRNDIHCALSKHPLKYSGWAKKMGIEQKSSDTVKGQKYELVLEKLFIEKGYEVERMTTKYPYDFLLNENVKVDVKVAAPHHHFGTRCHTFRPSKKHPTCDLYVCLALDEKEQTEKIFIIPSKFAQLVTLNICGEGSKYNAFIDRWDYINRFSEFYDSVEIAP